MISAPVRFGEYPINILPQETQPKMVEIEVYGIPVESRTLPAGWKDTCLCKLGPGKYCTKKPINIISQRILVQNFFLVFSISRTSSAALC